MTCGEAIAWLHDHEGTARFMCMHGKRVVGVTVERHVGVGGSLQEAARDARDKVEASEEARA